MIKLFSSDPTPEQFKPEARVSITGRSDDCNKRSEEVERCAKNGSDASLILNLTMYFLPHNNVCGKLLFPCCSDLTP